MEAEIYGFKMVQLFLPRPDHRDEKLAAVARQYRSFYPLVNENYTANLGAVGAFGFIGLLLVCLVSLSGKKVDERLRLFAIFTFILFLFGITGGLGSLFSASISSSIRGWNRISIFIAFSSIAAFFLILQIIISRYISGRKANVTFALCAVVFGCIGLYDQTASACLACHEKRKIAFTNDQNLIRGIENSLPAGAAIYQLPYIPFPEGRTQHRLNAYDHTVGYLHSKELHWSFAGMKGRQGDLFYLQLSSESLEKQIEVLKKLGFSGIYIDRRGYKDGGNAIIEELSRLLGAGPSLTRADGLTVFFRLPFQKIDFSRLSADQIIEKTGLAMNK